MKIRAPSEMISTRCQLQKLMWTSTLLDVGPAYICKVQLYSFSLGLKARLSTRALLSIDSFCAETGNWQSDEKYYGKFSNFRRQHEPTLEECHDYGV